MVRISGSVFAMGRTVAVVALLVCSCPADPPFSGTIFVDPDIITDGDPSTFIDMVSLGEGERQVFDRRVSQWINVNLYLFRLRFEEGLIVEARVNQEFDFETAAELVEKYAWVVGRIPSVLKRDVESITIHDGVQLFGGGNRNLLIHHGQGLVYEAGGILEEVFVHEAVHTSLDEEHALNSVWLAAQETDGEFISDHARNFPLQEDVAATFLVYLAIDYRRDRISQELFDTVTQTVPNRLAYLRNQPFDLYPVIPRQLAQVLSFSKKEGSDSLELVWKSDATNDYVIDQSFDLLAWEVVTSRLASQGLESRESIDVSNDELISGRFYRVRKLGKSIME